VYITFALNSIYNYYNDKKEHTFGHYTTHYCSKPPVAVWLCSMIWLPKTGFVLSQM